MSTVNCNKEANPFAICVIDEDGQIVYTVTVDQKSPEQSTDWATSMCHEHINDAIDSGLDFAGIWLVRRLYDTHDSQIPMSMNAYKAAQSDGSNNHETTNSTNPNPDPTGRRIQ